MFAFTVGSWVTTPFNVREDCMFLQRHFVKEEVSEIDDIEQNLAFALKSKRGASHDFNQMGLPDLFFRTAAEAVSTLKSAVPALIERHEPRLEFISVTDDYNDNGRPYITVKCRQRSTGYRVELVIDGSTSVVQFKLRET